MQIKPKHIALAALLLGAGYYFLVYKKKPADAGKDAGAGDTGGGGGGGGDTGRYMPVYMPTPVVIQSSPYPHKPIGSVATLGGGSGSKPTPITNVPGTRGVDGFYSAASVSCHDVYNPSLHMWTTRCKSTENSGV